MYHIATLLNKSDANNDRILEICCFDDFILYLILVFGVFVSCDIIVHYFFDPAFPSFRYQCAHRKHYLVPSTFSTSP